MRMADVAHDFQTHIAEGEAHDVAVMLEGFVAAVERIELPGSKPVNGWEEGGKPPRGLVQNTRMA